MNKTLTISAFLISILLSSYTLFELTIGDPGHYNEGISITPLEQGGFLISGAYNKSGSNGDWKSFLAALDKNGDTLWTKSNVRPNGIIKSTLDNNFVFAGGNIAGFNYDTIKLFKATITGDIIWEKAFFFPLCKNMVTDLEVVKDGFLLSGIYADNSCSNPTYDSFIMKLDEKGNRIWEYIISGSGNDQIHSIKEMGDGNVAAFGWTNTNTAQNNIDYLLIQLSPNGNLKWSKSFGNQQNNFGYGMDITDSDDFILVGYSNDIEVMHLDRFGEVVWEQSFGPACGGRYFKASISADGGYTFLANANINNQCTSVLIKTKKSGDILWRKELKGKLREFKEDSEGNYILTGYKSYLPDLYVVKFDSTRIRKYSKAKDSLLFEATIIKAPSDFDLPTPTDKQYSAGQYILPKVYPVPADNYVKIDFHNPNLYPYQFELFTIDGRRLLFHKNISKEEIMVEKQFPSGIYPYQLSGEGKIFKGKLLFD